MQKEMDADPAPEVGGSSEQGEQDQPALSGAAREGTGLLGRRLQAGEGNTCLYFRADDFQMIPNRQRDDSWIASSGRDRSSIS